MSHHPEQRSFCEGIRAARDQAGMSMRDMVALMNQHGYSLDSPAISRIESCERVLRITEAADFARVLGLELSQLDAPPQGEGVEAEAAEALRRYGCDLASLDRARAALDESARYLTDKATSLDPTTPLAERIRGTLRTPR